MKFAQMLMGVSDTLARELTATRKRPVSRTGLRPGEKTPEMLAKRKTTMRASRNATWKAAFDKYNGTATSEQLASILNRTVGSVNTQLINMRKESPPAVKVVARVECGSNHKKHLYKWLLD